MFFVVGKILWLVLQPSMLILLAVVAGGVLMLWGRRMRLGRWIFALGVAGLLVFGASPLSYALVSTLETRFPRQELAQVGPVAGLIILGGAAGGDTWPPIELASLNEAAERMTEGVALGLKLRDAPVVFSGGNGSLVMDVLPETESARRLLVALGIEERRIVLESRSRTTYENAIFTAAILNPKPGDRWLLVTSAWHMPRAMGSFRKAGFDVVAWPVDYRAVGAAVLDINVVEGLRRTDLAFREYLGLLAYYLSGRTSALLPAP